MDLFSRPLAVPLWKRGFAYLIDMVLIGIIILSPFFVKEDFQSSATDWKEAWTILEENVLAIFIINILILAYWTILEHKFQQSVGKIILGLVVKSTDKKRLQFTQALGRNITKLSLPLILIDCLGFLGHQKQRFTEQWTRTTVIYAKEK